jgi:hypothetical protein
MKTYTQKIGMLFFMSLCFNVVWSQSRINAFLKPSDSLNIARRNAVAISQSLIFVGGIIEVNMLYDKDHLDSKFHFSDNNVNYMQMDKAAHFMAAYHIGDISANALKWSGVSKKNQLIYGAGMGFVFLNTVEFIDGFASGTSVRDIVANTAGTSLYVSQELLWNEQRIVPKFSFQSSRFFSAAPRIMRLQIENEFDGQTYWLSANVRSFFKGTKFPKWLNLAAGYGVEGMDYRNPKAIPQEPGPYRQLFLSLDVDLTKIKTNSHVLKTFFYIFNSIKFPAPTLEIGESGRIKGHFFYF